MQHPLILSFLSLLLGLAPATAALAQHDGDLAVLATAASGGQLVLDGLEDGLVFVQPGFCAGGLCLYSATDPGFVSPSSPSGGLFPLASGTQVRVEIVSVQASAALKVGASVLDVTGEFATLGAAPSLHLHPGWQLTLPANAVEQRSLTIRVTAPGSSYSASAGRTFVLSTFVPATTTTTTSTSTTTDTTSTTVPVAYCGDCEVSAEFEEECDDGARNGTKGSACTADCGRTSCGDPDHNSRVTATDATFVLRTAVAGTGNDGDCSVDPVVDAVGCDQQVCDVDGSGAITASDALRTLRVAVGQAVVFRCPVD